MAINVYCDAGGKPPIFWWGYVVATSRPERKTSFVNEKEIECQFHYQAEYIGLLNVVRAFRFRVEPEIHIYMDNQSAVKHFNGEFKTKNAWVKMMIAKINAIAEDMGKVITVTWVPREQNLAGLMLEDFLEEYKRNIKKGKS